MAYESDPTGTPFERLLATLVPLASAGARLDRERGLIETAHGSLITVDKLTRAAEGGSSARWEEQIVAFLAAVLGAEADLTALSVTSWPSVAPRLRLHFEPHASQLFTPVIEVGGCGTLRVSDRLLGQWDRTEAQVGRRARGNTLTAALGDHTIQSVTTSAGVVVVGGSPLISSCLLDLHRLVAGCERGGALVSVPDDETVFVVPLPATQPAPDPRSTLDVGRRLAGLTAAIATPGPMFLFHRPGRFAMFDVTGAKP